MTIDIATIRRTLERLAGRVSAIEETLDRLLCQLDDADGLQRTASRGRPARVPPPKPLVSLCVELHRDGGSRVVADGDTPLDLSPRLSELLLFLVVCESDAEGIKPFHRLSDAAKSLRASRSGLSTLVHRLRRELKKHGLDGRLIETDRRKRQSWVRFRTQDAIVIRAADK